MRPIFMLMLALAIISGCAKNGAPTPHNSSTGKSSDDAQTLPSDTTPKMSHDDSIHMAVFKIQPQTAKVSVSGTKLVLVYHENVDLLFSREGYQKISAVHLKEDFSKSNLAGLDYTTIAEGGNTTLNWVDDNLNNVILKTVTDTVVNNRSMVKINVHRAFTFTKTYSSADEAQAATAAFTGQKRDTVAFSSFCYYNQKNYLPVTSSAGISYSK